MEKYPDSANRSSWKNYPIDKPKRIEIDLHFTDEQVELMKKGIIPEQMEDKWFIFYENAWLYFHRSWTGDGLYKAKLIKEKEGYSISEFWVERNTEKYTQEDDDQDIRTFLILILISVGLLGIDPGLISRLFDGEIGISSEIRNWSMFGRLLFS